MPRLLATRFYKGQQSINFITNSVENCKMACYNYGFDIAGSRDTAIAARLQCNQPQLAMETGTECWCGNAATYNYKNSRLVRAGAGFQCNWACAGNSLQMCGGPWALSVYSRVDLASATQSKNLTIFHNTRQIGKFRVPGLLLRQRRDRQLWRRSGAHPTQPLPVGLFQPDHRAVPFPLLQQRLLLRRRRRR